jgi:5'-phosphate synthase pdxT subunit
MRVGVLALQGDFREHMAMLAELGADARPVRTADELAEVDGLVIPGGESTTIGKLAHRYRLLEPLRGRIESGMPVLGTCAGLIFLAASTTGPDQHQIGVLDVVVERNAFGRQVDSFEEDLDVAGWDEPLRAVYIRAPWISKVGAGVEVLARSVDHPVMVRQGRIIATAFHPELTEDTRVHRLLVDEIGES